MKVYKTTYWIVLLGLCSLLFVPQIFSQESEDSTTYKNLKAREKTLTKRLNNYQSTIELLRKTINRKDLQIESLKMSDQAGSGSTSEYKALENEIIELENKISEIRKSSQEMISATEIAASKKVEFMQTSMKEGLKSLKSKNADHEKEIKEHEKTIMWLIGKRDEYKDLLRETEKKTLALEKEISDLKRKTQKNESAIPSLVAKEKAPLEDQIQKLTKELERLQAKYDNDMQKQAKKFADKVEADERIFQLKEEIVNEINSKKKLLEDQLALHVAEKQRLEQDVSQLSVLLEESEASIPVKISEIQAPLQVRIQEMSNDLEIAHITSTKKDNDIQELREKIGVLESQLVVNKNVTDTLNKKLVNNADVSTELERAKLQIDSLMEDNQSLEFELINLQEMLDETTLSIPEKIAEVQLVSDTAMQALQKKMEKTNKDRDAAQSAKKDLSEEITVLKRQLEIRAKESEELLSQTKQLNNKLSKTEESLELAKKQEKLAVKDKLDSFDKKMDGLKLKLEAKDKEIANLNKNISNLKKELVASNDYTVGLEKEVVEYVDVIENIKKDMQKQVKENKIELSKELEAVQRELNTSSNVIQEKDNEVVSLKLEKMQADKELDALRGKELDLTDQIDTLKNQVNVLETANQMEMDREKGIHKKQLAALQKQYDELQKDYAVLNSQFVNLKDIEKKYNDLQNKESALNRELNAINRKIQQAEDIIPDAIAKARIPLDEKILSLEVQLKVQDELVKKRDMEIQELQKKYLEMEEYDNQLKSQNDSLNAQLDETVKQMVALEKKTESESGKLKSSLLEDQKRLQSLIEAKEKTIVKMESVLSSLRSEISSSQEKMQEIILEKTGLENSLFLCEEESSEIEKTVTGMIAKVKEPLEREKKVMMAQLEILESDLTGMEIKYEELLKEKELLLEKLLSCQEESAGLLNEINDMENVVMNR